MNIKEKFKIINCKNCKISNCEIECTILSDYELNKLEQIADQYAIEFSKWVTSNNSFFLFYRSTKELLEIFKKEKK